MASVSFQSFLLHYIHSCIIFLVPLTASIFLSKLKHLNKPCHVVQLLSNLVLFIYARDSIKILTFINCLGSNSQSYSVYSCYWFQMTFHHLASISFALIVVLEMIVIFCIWHDDEDLKFSSSSSKLSKITWFFV